MAERYVAFALGDLDRVPTDRDRLAAFAELAASSIGAVADLGCGPGHEHGTVLARKPRA